MENEALQGMVNDQFIFVRCTQIARAEGLPGFYRGFGAILLTVIPANMCYFSGYEAGKRLTPRNWGVASDLMTATIAQTVAGIAFCPIDIVKQRVQTAAVMAGPAVSLTPLLAARQVWAHQGLRGFYKGYWTMNALWYPWNAIYLTMYEAAKRRVYHWQLERDAAAAAIGSASSEQGTCHTQLAVFEGFPVVEQVIDGVCLQL